MDSDEHISASNEFCPPFTPSRTPALLDPSALPLPKVPRAWDRVAQQPANPDSRIQTIYKLRPRTLSDDGDIHDVKKLRVEPCRAISTLSVRDRRDYETHKVPNRAEWEEEVADDGLTTDPGLSGEEQQENSLEEEVAVGSPSKAAPADDARHNSEAIVGAREEINPQFAILEEFVARYDANKKAANVTRRASLQNKRDSGKVRLALASPRQPLEKKDGNLSPRKSEEAVSSSRVSPPALLPHHKAPTLHHSITDGFPGSEATKPTEPPKKEEIPDNSPDSNTDKEIAPEPTTLRRSTRERKQSNFLSSAAAGKTTKKITIGGGSKIKSMSVTPEEAATNLETLTNTRLNKFDAPRVPQRLMQLQSEGTTPGELDVDVLMQDYTAPGQETPDKLKKSVQWPDNLVQGYQDAPMWANSTRMPPRSRTDATSPAALDPEDILAEADATRAAESANSTVRSVSRSSSASSTSASLLLSVSLPPLLAPPSSSTSLLAPTADKPRSRLPRTPRRSQNKKTPLSKLVLTPSTASVSGIATPARRSAREDGDRDPVGVKKRGRPREMQTPGKRWVARAGTAAKSAG